MGFKVIDVQSTPNPNAMKFVLDRPVSDVPVSFFDAASAKSHELASRLFAVTGVQSVLLLNDFVTINKADSGRWASIKKSVQQILASII